jgi:hypothetical protein
MKKRACLAVALFFMSLSPAFADFYNFSYVDGTFNVSGTLLVSREAGLFTVTGGTMGDAALYTGAGAVPAGAYYTSPAGAFWYDNMLSPGSTPAISYWGLLFTQGAAGGADYKEINIWGNNGANDYSYDEWAGGSYSNAFNNGTFTVTEASSVPEPPAVVLVGFGLLCLAVFARTVKKYAGDRV